MKLLGYGGGGLVLSAIFIGVAGGTLGTGCPLSVVHIVYFSIGSGAAVFAFAIGGKHGKRVFQFYTKPLTRADIEEMKLQWNAEVKAAQANASFEVKWTAKRNEIYTKQLTEIEGVFKASRIKKLTNNEGHNMTSFPSTISYESNWQDLSGITEHKLNKTLNNSNIYFQKLSNRTNNISAQLSVSFVGLVLAAIFIFPPGVNISSGHYIHVIDAVYLSIGSGIAVATLISGCKAASKLSHHYTKKLSKMDLARLQIKWKAETGRVNPESLLLLSLQGGALNRLLQKSGGKFFLPFLRIRFLLVASFCSSFSRISSQ